MTYSVNAHHSAQALPGTKAPARLSLLSFVTTRLELLRQRRSLRALDARALEDIGISRRDALQEAGRSVWDAPESWKD
ncbi:DUF1127 domain-containing protein [Pseudophaeobacter sp.]|jgi:uncharacterized protein YjiS (DUF1127 family)|uniref:DUF1127 domain-containing protein n=1 Tax=Pseudophaeobacter sp. TaxID=1971739 RepID=UPI0026178A5D|nr:DUF1127 domain-containing protein [Pseudophaeobacter sp.]